MHYTKSKGDSDELFCISKFIKHGYSCSIPYGNGDSYDFILDFKGHLFKIQCKSSIPVFDKAGEVVAISFGCKRVKINSKGCSSKGYDNFEVDYFVTCFENEVYIVPIDECKSSVTLRFVKPKYDHLNCRFADDYRIERFLGHGPMSHDYSVICKRRCEICNDCCYGKICISCKGKKSKISTNIDRDELKKLIRNKPFVQIGKAYGVSDNAVRKWCKFYKLPFLAKEIKSFSEEDWDLL